MKRRVNFTERKRIKRESITVEIVNATTGSFIVKFDLQEYKFPAKSKVVLDTICAGSEIVERFDFGTVGKTVPPQNLCLNDKLVVENIRFTLKVIDVSDSNGRILGIAENIRPSGIELNSSKTKQNILPIIPARLGEQLWRLDFGGNEVSILVNEDIPQLQERFGTDSVLQSLVFPAIIREILYKTCIHEGYDDNDDQTGWQKDWMVKFAKILDSEMPSKDDDEESKRAWIENVIDKFCEKHQLKQNYSKLVGDNA